METYKKELNADVAEAIIGLAGEYSDVHAALAEEADLDKEGPEEFMARIEAERKISIEIEAGSYLPGLEGLGEEGSPAEVAALGRESQEWAEEEGLLRGQFATGREVYPDAISDAGGTPGLIAGTDDFLENRSIDPFQIGFGPDDWTFSGAAILRELGLLKEN